MRIFIIALMALLLTACASPQTQPLIPSAAIGGMSAFGTLASFGTFEMSLAPAYTRLAVLRHNAAQALNKGFITVDVAKEIQAKADVVREKLDHARALDADKQTQAANDMLNGAVSEIKQLEEKLK